MNGDISRIPIQSLGAVFSLTDILPELPLPSAFPLGSGSDSFLSDPAISNDAMRCLCSKDETLIACITETLSKVSTDNIDLDEQQNTESFENAAPPPLLISVLQRNASVFQSNPPLNKPNSLDFKWDSQQNPTDSDVRQASYDEAGGSPTRRKHKRKKRKKRKTEASSGGESNAATPSGSTGDGLPAAADDTRIPTPYGVSVDVKPDEKKILLKFSLKRPTISDTATSPDTGHKERKEKKHKKPKDRDRKRHHSREKSYLMQEDGSTKVQALPSSNGVPMTAKPVLVPSPNPALSDQLNRKLPPPTLHSPHSILDRISVLGDVKSPHSFDLQGVFDHEKPDFTAFSENFLKDLPSSVISHSISTSHPLNSSSQNYNDFLPADLLSNLSPTAPHHTSMQGADDGGVYRGSFMIASHLEYDAKPPANFLEHISDLHNASLSMSTPQKMSESNASQATPLGLASYLNSSKPLPTPIAKSAPAKPSARRRAQVSKRRRCNEVEGLRTWTVKYPGQKNSDRLSDESSAWDAAVDRHTNYLRNKRRRMTRQPTALAADYVLENDKDYPKPLPRHDSDGDLETSGEGVAGGEEPSSDNETACLRSSSRLGPGASGTVAGTGGRCSYAGMDDDVEDVADDDCYKDAGGSRRRRKADEDDAPFEFRLKEPAEQRFPHLQKVAAEQSRPVRERVRHRLPTTFSDVSGASDAALVSSLKKFLGHIDRVLEAVEEVDLLASGGGGAGDDCAPSEAIISPSDLAELCRDAAKLKSTQIANQVPTDRLVKLLTLLLLNIRDGASVVRVAGDHESLERITRAVSASLIAVNLMTAKDMPREIYLEDVIEQAVQVTRFQLSNCIYPEYDPAYRIENSAKDNQSSIKSRRARERDTHKPSSIVHLYYRLVEIVSGLAELVNIQRLTDSLVLTLCSVGVSIFFVENVSELQLAALKLVTGIFAQYPTYRNLIVEDIITSIARLPSSKRNLRTYRLNSEESIQMFTALALLLVQSVIELPPTGANVHHQRTLGGGDLKTEGDETASGQDAAVASRPDNEVLVTSSYKKALITAHTFLSVFLRKSTTRGEDDYRIIFENFVNDLLLTVNKPEWPAAEVMLSLLGSLLVQQFNNKSLDQSVRVTSVDYLGTVASTLRRDAVTSQLKEHDIDAILRELTEGNQSDSEDDLDEDEVENEEEQASTAPNSVRREEEAEAEGAGGSVERNGLNVEEEAVERKKKKTKTSKVNLRQMDKILVLRDAVLDYLLEDESDPVVVYACKFYMGQWLEDCATEVDRAHKAASDNPAQPASESAARKKPGSRRGNGVVGGSGRKRRCLLASDDEAEEGEGVALTDVELAELRRTYLMDRLRDPPSLWRARCRPKVAGMMFLSSAATAASTKVSRQSQALRVTFKGTIDYEDAYLICRYLASLRPFSQSFDVYLSQICKLLSESSVAVRTKALRCLSAVVEADPGVLARSDIEMAVRSRLMDTSTSVREAAVDLLGRFLVCRPELTAQYYPMLSDRIRDKGVSVRKRVIRILRDICVEQPDFPRIAEICVKIIRRVNDEESVKKLVSEVFQTLWFTPVREKESVKLLHKVMNITDVVVSASKDTGIEWLEQFLEALLTKEESEKVRPAEKACVQIVECLVQNIMRLEEIPGQTKRLVACLATLHLFTKIRPQLTVKHAMLLQPYLSARVSPSGTPSSAHLDSLTLHYVARILEVTIPLVEHPSETFLAQLEEDLVRLTLRQGKMVLESCVACLGAVVNRVSKNYALARECFQGFFNALVKVRDECAASSGRESMPKLPQKLRPSILRALFTVGLLCKHFDTRVFSLGAEPKILNQVFETLMFFSEKMTSDLEVRKNALAGLGFLCTRHYELLCGTRLCKFYHDLLQCPADHDSERQNDMELKSLILENLLSFFLEEERRMLEQDAKWKATHKEESLKVMGDVASGIGSHVAQSYLKEILETFFVPSSQVRFTALSVVTTILRQGLMHPVQTVPYLIAMQTDPDVSTRVKAEAQLQEIENKFPGFIYMRAIEGVCFAYRLQCVLHAASKVHLEGKESNAYSASSDTNTAVTTPRSQATPQKPRRCPRTADTDSGIDGGAASSSSDALGVADAIRGARDVDSDVPNALNSQLYSMLRTNRTFRRAFLNGLINLFDELQNISLGRLVYVADNLAFFPYQCQAEPLFVIHHIDLLVSVNGSTRLQAVREALFPELKDALAPPPPPPPPQPTTVNNGFVDVAAWMPLPAHGDDRLAFSTDFGFRSPSTAEMSETPVQHHAHHHHQHAVVSSSEPGPTVNPALARLEAEEENEDAMVARVLAADPAGLASIQETIKASRACLLLLNLKQYLKEVYGITDSKIQKYSPSDSGKLWEKQLTRKSGVRFFPTLCLRSAIEEIATGGGDLGASTSNTANQSTITEEAARDLVLEFVEFRKLILSIDPPEDDDVDISLNAAATVEGLVGDDKHATLQIDDIPIRLAPGRSLVPQSHARSSDEEDDSADSDAGGASRLLLAQSAPQRRRGAVTGVGGSGGGGGVGVPSGRSSRGSRSGVGTATKRRKPKQSRVRSVYISSSESESDAETISSEEESS
uniref:Nipped-B protein n=1 Tax=Mesocestoides corti TaxID=53468 RepID=A0A5K3F1J8_MESCO